MAATLDEVVAEIRRIQHSARAGGARGVPRWPMIVLRTPKGWTGPKEVDGQPVEGTWRAHQVPIADLEKPGHLAILEQWMRSYRPEELFTTEGTLRPDLAALAPAGERRMSANPHANGGMLLRDLVLPDFRDYAVEVTRPAASSSEATRVLGMFLRDVIRDNPDNFRLLGPDETASNRLGAVFEVTDRCWLEPVDARRPPAPDGRVMEVLSEHHLPGLAGGVSADRPPRPLQLLRGVHPHRRLDGQPAREVAQGHQPHPLAAADRLPQLPAQLARLAAGPQRVLPPGPRASSTTSSTRRRRWSASTCRRTRTALLSVADHCLRSRNYVNVVVAGKQPAPQCLTMDEAVAHCTRGLGIWDWASNDGGGEPGRRDGLRRRRPDAGDAGGRRPARQHLPDLKVRFVNVVDLMKLQPPSEHPHGLPDGEFDALFTTDKPVIFAYHGYPWLIHRLTYRPARTTTTSTSAATRRRGRRRRRSTW